MVFKENSKALRNYIANKILQKLLALCSRHTEGFKYVQFPLYLCKHLVKEDKQV